LNLIHPTKERYESKIMTAHLKTIRNTHLTALSVIIASIAGSVDAALVVTSHTQGTNPDTFYNSLINLETGLAPSDTGSNRTSLDAPPSQSDSLGQSFTLTSSITLDSIYFAYNDQQNTGTFDFRIDIGNTGTNDHTYTVSVPNSWESGGNNGGDHHMLQFDVSSENITLAAGQHAFSVLGTLDNEDNGGAFLFAPFITQNDEYAGGGTIGSLGNGSNDMFFAVTSVPEPSSSLLVASAMGLALLRRRR
jgi:hypothetical protein